MTDERLAELQALADAATPGPWLTPSEAGDPYRVDIIDHEGCNVWPWKREEDMVFAYVARMVIPELIAEIRRLKRCDLTPEEFNARCHHRDERPGCTPLDFADGCQQYSTQLFGHDNRVVVMRGELTKDV